ncbi:hypothetical protein [Rhodovarius sp.]
MADNDTVFGKIIAKAWRDPAFKAALIANPAPYRGSHASQSLTA